MLTTRPRRMRRRWSLSVWPFITHPGGSAARFPRRLTPLTRMRASFFPILRIIGCGLRPACPLRGRGRLRWGTHRSRGATRACARRQLSALMRALLSSMPSREREQSRACAAALRFNTTWRSGAAASRGGKSMGKKDARMRGKGVRRRGNRAAEPPGWFDEWSASQRPIADALASDKCQHLGRRFTLHFTAVKGKINRFHFYFHLIFIFIL